MGFFSKSKSSSTSITDIDTTTLAGGTLGDVNQDSPVAASVQLQNILDSDIGITFEQQGLSGEDVRELIGGVGESFIEPTNRLVGNVVQAFGASQSTTAALTGTLAKGLDTLKDLAIPLVIGGVAFALLRR